MTTSTWSTMTRRMDSSARSLITTIVMITVLLHQPSLVEPSIHFVDEAYTQTRHVGETAQIPFIYCTSRRPTCETTNFNFSGPNSACTLDGRYDHCRLERAPSDDPIRQRMMSTCELCVLTVTGLTQLDAGTYAICQTNNPCTSHYWRNVANLTVTEDNETTTTAPKTADTSKKTTTQEPGNGVTDGNKPANITEAKTAPASNKPGINETQTKLSSAVGIPFTIIILVILVVVCVVYLYRNQRMCWNNHRQPLSETPNTTPDTTPNRPTCVKAEVVITMNQGQNGYHEGICENSLLRNGDPELNT